MGLTALRLPAERSKNVKLVLNDRVVSPALGEQPQDGKIITAAGHTIAADAVIWAVGTKPVSEFVASSWPETVQSDGLVKVDQYLRVIGHQTVFAAGDITNPPENRLAIIGGLHAKSIAAKIIARQGHRQNPSRSAVTTV